MLKPKMMLCVMMLPLVVVGCTSAVCQSVVKPPPPPAWIMQPPRLADTAERDYFTLRERLITMQNNWKEPRSILMSSADRVAHRWATHAIIVSTHNTSFQRSINTKVIKPSNPFTNVCWVSVLTTFSAHIQFWLHRQFSSPNSRNRNDKMVFFGATAAGLF